VLPKTSRFFENLWLGTLDPEVEKVLIGPIQISGISTRRMKKEATGVPRSHADWLAQQKPPKKG